MRTNASMVSFIDEFLKISAELTPAARQELPKKDFAVSAKKSNTGERAYPIPDRQHAASALGFAKMHGDTADYERVKAKVMAKYPDMVKSKEKTSDMSSAGNFGPGTAPLPGMVNGPPGHMPSGGGGGIGRT